MVIFICGQHSAEDLLEYSKGQNMDLVVEIKKSGNVLEIF